jgi:hypothetical protein
MQLSQTISELGAIVQRVLAENELGQCMGYSYFGDSSGQNIVQCERPATMCVDDVPVCAVCYRRGSY